jgi:uncharacterized membrane protein (UPF0127 family)
MGPAVPAPPAESVGSVVSAAWTLAGFDELEVTVDGAPVTVALADTPALRRRGLQQVVDLGRAQGMLFSWGGGTVDSRFTMRDTLIALDIGFFDVDGRLVDLVRMTPCAGEPCPSYGASAPYAFALEIPVGGSLEIDESTVLAGLP